MSPAMRLGNWVRKVCPCVRDNTEPLKEEEGALEPERLKREN